ncbi:CPBP family intramembrane metalloprotease [bacterium]|nr:CPBP family intramembrane metalloprotease [bacterium]
MSFQIANLKQIVYALALSACLGCFLAWGFQPTSLIFTEFFLKSVSCGETGFCQLLDHSGFLLMAFLFYISLPDAPPPILSPFSRNRLLTLCVLPVLIAGAYGFSKSGHISWQAGFWTWIIIPLAEEWLFRGWLLALLNRIFPNAFLAGSSLFPLSIWGSALAFSCWHLQSWGQISLTLLGLQLFYTFCVGMWLGFLKWQTRSLWPSILAHFLINFAADLKLLLML